MRVTKKAKAHSDIQAEEVRVELTSPLKDYFFSREAASPIGCSSEAEGKGIEPSGLSPWHGFQDRLHTVARYLPGAGSWIRTNTISRISGLQPPMLANASPS